jgi:hypothetical protein
MEYGTKFPGTFQGPSCLDGMRRSIYKLSPTTPEWDPNWDLAENQGEVIVRADSPADARIVASEAEPDFLESDAKPGMGTSTRHASAFQNEQLYSVTEIDSDAYSRTGPRELLGGTVKNPLKGKSISRS